MSAAVVILVLLAALVLAVLRGPRVAFPWVFFPALILIPIEISAGIPGFPDLNGRRAALIGILVGSVIGGGAGQLAPRWRAFDLFPVGLVLVHSLSFGSKTNAFGFLHSVAVLTLDWLVPYILVRALWRDYRDVKQGLKPLVYASVFLGMLTIYETRMAARVSRLFWNALTGLSVPGYFEMWRWGYLRAFGTFTHPITLGVFFATVAPLMILWGQIEPRYRLHSRIAAFVCALACMTSLSRGPMLALLAAAVLGWFLTRQRPLVYVLLVPALVLLLPVAMTEMGEAIQFTQQELADRGNTDSGYYRLALLLIYLDDIGKVGWLGNPEVVGQDYEAAWSIDNGYLYLFVEGGWLGGGLFMAMVFAILTVAGLSLRRSRGAVRRVRATGFAGLLGVLFGMADVWFAPDYAPMFFVCSAVMLNLTRRAWFAARPGLAPRPGAPPPSAPRRPALEWQGAAAAVSQR
jgi:hypothetical protein